MDPFAFRLAEQDATRFERGGDEFLFDPDPLVRDLTAGQLEAIEAELPDTYSLVLMLAELYQSQSARAMRTAMWVARRAAGVEEPYASFDPVVLRARMDRRPRAVAGDPPVPGSSTSSGPDESATGSSTSLPA
ncbi:MAG TPA: hypothetical protein VFM37_04655 [Pseudonocardiaceae bacterium]|nr:hypothetical protein [Pseudonocardiaceae bacterium]